MNFKLSGAVRQNERSFKSGQERDLLPLLSEEQKRDFVDRGLLVPVAIEGVPLEEPALEPATVGLSNVDPAEIAASYISSTFGIERSSDETPAQFIEALVADLRSGQAAKDQLAEQEDGKAEEPLLALKPLGIDVVGSLIDAGFDTPEKVSDATDEQLKTVPGIGPATVGKIRDLLKPAS